MLNPNVNKRVIVKVLPRVTNIQYAEYRGQRIEIADMETKSLGMRRMYLRYSIFNDCYYLKTK